MKRHLQKLFAVIFKGKNGWYFRLKAMNGEVIAASESYTRKHDAIRGAKRINRTCDVRVK